MPAVIGKPAEGKPAEGKPAEGKPAEGMPAASQRSSAREIAASLALAAVGFVFTAALLHTAIRDPLHLHADVRSEKLSMLDQWHGKVFSAAFGTSHVHNGFDPRAFDAGLAGSPGNPDQLATHSANLAIEGGSQTEQFVMASEFLKHLESPAHAGAPPQPCLVILEAGAGVNFTPDHLVHPRAINIYDWPTTMLALHFASPAAAGPAMPRTQRLARAGYAFAAMGLHFANIGMLSNRIFAPPLNAEILEQQTADDRRGELVLPGSSKNLPALERMVAGMPAEPSVSSQPVSPGLTTLVERLAVASPVNNVSFVLVEMPKIADKAHALDLPDHLTVASPRGQLVVPILNLDRSDRFPQVFEPRLWFDDSHLNGEGAALTSRLFAEQLKAWYAAHGEPTPCG